MAADDFALESIRFDPDGEGPGAVLGPLESKVMEAVWAAGRPVTVREVFEGLGKAKGEDLAYTTVLTIFSRLAEKGLLERESKGRTHRFRPTSTRVGFLQGVLKKLIGGLARQLRGTAGVGLLDELPARDRAALAKLLAREGGDPS